MSIETKIVGAVYEVSELRTTKSGDHVCNVTVPVDDGFGDKKKTTYYEVTIFGKSAEAASKYLERGTFFSAVGKPTARAYQSTKGELIAKVGITAKSWEMYGRRQAKADAVPDFQKTEAWTPPTYDDLVL